MKRIFLLVVLVFLTVGCGLGEAAQDTTSSIGTNSQERGKETAVSPTITVNAENVKCDVHPFAGSSEAGVTCQVEVIEDAFIWAQSKEPFIIFATGRLKVNDGKFSFADAEPFSIAGSGTMNTCEVRVPWEKSLFSPCGLPYLTITMTNLSETAVTGNPPTGLISEVPFDIAMTLSVMAATQETLNTVSLPQNDYWLFEGCYKLLIPDSGLAGIIMIGELKSRDQPVGILGTIDRGNMTKDEAARFECSLDNQELTIQQNGSSYVAVMTHPFLKMDDGTVWELKNSNIIVPSQDMVFNTQEGFITYAE